MPDTTEARRHSTLAGLRVSADRWLPAALREWIEAEQGFVHRRVDRRLIDPGTIDEVPEPWRPEAQRRFLFPSVWLADAELVGRAPSGLVRTRRGRREVLFVWHPAAASKVARLVANAEPGPRFFGAVTSSIRTVLLWPAETAAIEPFFAKLSLPLEVANASRIIDRSHVRHAVEANDLLAKLKTAITFLAEPCGVVPAAAPDASFIVRTVPRGRWRPFFAFTSRGTAHAPRLLDALVDAWLEVTLEHGLALEAHAQNLLVEVDARRRPTGRFGFRDLHGVVADGNVLARRLPSLARLVDRLVAARSPVFDDPDEALAESFHRFLLGGPAAGVRKGQRRAVERVSSRLGVDAGSADQLVAAVHVERAKRLTIPKPPRWLSTFLERDQGANDRVREPTFFAPVDLTAVPTAYDPARHPCWPVDALELAHSEASALGTRSSIQRAGRRHRLFVHPFMRTRLGLLTLRPLRRTRYFASPTSSPRTLALWDGHGHAFAVKVSLDVELLGLSRLVHGSKLRRAIAIDRGVACISKRVLEREGVTFLREPEALWVRERDDGQIIRVLEPVLGHVVPGFGLFARGGPLDAVPRRSLLETIDRWVLQPLARVSAFLLFEEGLVGQLHQQNVLFEVGREGRPNGRLVLRDLDAFVMDDRVRKVRGRTLVPLEARPEVKSLFDRAWGVSCRGDFGFLAERVLERRGLESLADELYRRFDLAFFSEAARRVGESVVRAELEWVRRRSPETADRRIHPEWSFDQLLERTAATTFFAADRRQIGYSVNALVHAWLASLR